MAHGAWAALTIDSAVWDGRKLTAKGTGDKGETVTLANTDDMSQVLGSSRAGGKEGSWTIRATQPNPIPCFVTASADGESDVTLDVAGAPANCTPPQGACDISVTPATLPFGDVTIDQSSTLSTIVSNSGTAACNVTLAKTGSEDFAINSETSLEVAPSASQTVSVSYTPGQTGPDTGNIEVSSNDANNPSVDIALSGNGVEQQVDECNISVNPTTLAFGDVNVGQSSELVTTVSNTGTADCNVELVQPGSEDFEVALPLGFTVAANESRDISVNYAPADVGEDTDTLAVNSDDPNTPNVDVALSGNGVELQACNPVNSNLSINSTSQNGCPDATLPQVGQVPNASYSVLAINDLGMHCGDLDTRIASILPPFQAMLAQVIQKGASPVLNPAGVDVYYSATSNPNDPILDSIVFDGLMTNGDTYKTNFWDFPVIAGTYDAFYPAFNPLDPTQTLTPLSGPPFNVGPDVGLPVPNVEHLYIGADGAVNSGDETLTAVLHAMPGIVGPYSANDPKHAEEHYGDKPFFVNFPFGYVAADVNWYEGAGIPFAAFDDFGRENAYPLVRVEARQGPNTLSTVDTVLPISGEANCTNCHAQPDDLLSVTGKTSRSTAPTDALEAADLPVVLSLDDPDNNLPPRVSLEYAADINTLRLHDEKHGAKYVAPSPADDGTTVAAACDITANNGDGDTNCLTNKALVQKEPVVCQVCHYTPALDLAQLGPLTGPEGSVANGRNQLAHRSNSNVMHSHHGSLGVFPEIPAPNQDADGTITNQADRLLALEESCYQCHPGSNTQCLRGAMFNGGMLCNDCHGNMEQVGNDFSAKVSPTNQGAFELGGNFYDPNDPQPRVPWANEPGCGSCHTGDANTTMAGDNGTLTNTVDINGNADNIRLRVAYRVNPDGTAADQKATPIVPTDKRFAEPAVPAAFNGFANPGAGNPQLYRVSTGHGGVMCEGCHGATHAEWPNGNPNANDNVTANQLQGHTGTIIECSTCHGEGWEPNIENGEGLGGPHGMHVVGDSEFARSKHKEVNPREECFACHGGNSRNNSHGTVLSRAATTRTLETKNDLGTITFQPGEPVGCADCH